MTKEDQIKLQAQVAATIYAGFVSNNRAANTLGLEKIMAASVEAAKQIIQRCGG